MKSRMRRKNNFYKIILRGQVSEEFTLNEDFLQESLKDQFHYVKIIDKSEIRLDMDELMKRGFIKKYIC